MSDVYDITVYPSILNGSGVNLSGCVSYRFLRSIQVPLADRLQFGYDTYHYTISEKTRNSKLFLSVLKGGDGWGEPGGGVFSYYNVFYISDASIGGVDGNVVSITTYGVNYGNSPLVPNAGMVNVYEILPEGSQEANNNYSIKIYNGVDWTAFDSHLSIGAMHRKYSVTVGSAGWELPMDVPDRDNCLVFGDWDSASSSIIYRNVEHKLYAFPGPVNIDIYVFSNTPNLTVGEYGLLMYNSLGELTFSSENPPLCYPYEGFVIDSTPRQLPFLNNLVQLSTFGVRYTTTLSRIHLWDVNVLRAGNMISLIQGNLRVDVVQKVGVTELPIPPGRPLILNRDIYGK